MGRVDAWVSSTDKNFLVPVGGAIVASPSTSVIEAVSRCYPGRAALSPILDFFITLIQMGTQGLARILEERKAVAVELRARIADVASRHGERLLESRGNPISFAMSIDNITQRLGCPALSTDALSSTSCAEPLTVAPCDAIPVVPGGVHVLRECERVPAGHESPSNASTPDGVISNAGLVTSRRPLQPAETYLGAMLFSRGVSGTRVVSPTEVRTIDRWRFVGYGAQCNAYPCAYITAAAAIGMTLPDVSTYCDRLDATIKEYKQKMHLPTDSSGTGPKLS